MPNEAWDSLGLYHLFSFRHTVLRLYGEISDLLQAFYPMTAILNDRCCDVFLEGQSFRHTGYLIAKCIFSNLYLDKKR